ncbi:MAG: hypothetical protein RNU03_18675 [Candidatus Sedimenticola sp. (ex Thyasira tokunagai)]
MDQLAKTDKIDAQVIAEFAAVVQPSPTTCSRQEPSYYQRPASKKKAAHGDAHQGVEPCADNGEEF